MPADFSVRRWERARRRVVATAFLRVPFYRDQWAAAGRALAEPEPTPSAALADQLHRLCPFARPFDPSLEPSPWIGDGRDLRDALALAGAPRRAPVLEVRPAVLDRRTLAGGVLPWGGGRRYGVLLAPGARVVDGARRRALDAAALGLAAEAGQAIVVGERAALDAVLPQLEGVRVCAVERVPLGQAVRAARAAAAARTPQTRVVGGVVPDRVVTGRMVTGRMVTDHAAPDHALTGHAVPDHTAADQALTGHALPGHAAADRAVPGPPFTDHAVAAGAMVAHDPHLGYLAAVVPACGQVHLLWRHVHARPFESPGGPTVGLTALRRRRAALVNVVPDDAESLTTALCPAHGTPVVTPPVQPGPLPRLAPLGSTTQISFTTH
ncbi:hypothetical protein HTZ77_23585 [Nonomuraea sp. SMC257]|uniref:Uncharacterized protein n=1 Tax=Nonomuraea montanisoli TaxID=2741721 RepID=A0A7Y6M594_9ACTN|nr:hypothetical protein [Nonomuraea montanisoli]NUW34396.1 hypothetical protein [Nonomuraea montanisoli]